ncbi:MAG: 4-(cytidine 5'-diphospho)-2-C-methyl-D-erythritol kinase [Candidatus Neomarinimicrobiota bacterium]|nr:4-(cytidine 5'-diphospho)-2-C-methyl-D-erythritol kinase [Candidatus Neomarinimicrobiota bacterium]
MQELQSIPSNAKINLGLKVLNKRPDNYHNIQSLFIEINLSDELHFIPNTNHKLLAEGNFLSQFPLNEKNLITKAYKLMYSHLRFHHSEYLIKIKKNIPIGSGLGGGSSNAATTLKILNKLWDLNFTNKKLMELGLSLGADIPFFIEGGVQMVEGLGEKLSPQKIDVLNDLCFLLVVPPIHISTTTAYAKLNKSLDTNHDHSKFPPVSKLVNWQLFENDFENMIGKTYPEIRKIKKNLYDLGALYSGLSGSGSAMFGVFDNLNCAQKAQKEFSNQQTFLASPVFHS